MKKVLLLSVAYSENKIYSAIRYLFAFYVHVYLICKIHLIGRHCASVLENSIKKVTSKYLAVVFTSSLEFRINMFNLKAMSKGYITFYAQLSY